MRRYAFALSLVVAAATMTIAGQAPLTARLRIVQRAATTLGGADRIRAIRNITLAGYGDSTPISSAEGASQEIPTPGRSTSPPNELSRVYDIEHGRFQLLERRNMLFPFLGPSATAGRL